MTTALIYARVSTEEQGRGYSLPEQIGAAERRAAERGYTVANAITEEFTGTEAERPGIEALYTAIDRTGAQIVLCHDTDRLGRGWPRGVIERLIEAHGARVEYVLADYSGEAGELQKDIRAAIDAWENRQRLERSRRGKNGKARAGAVIVTAGRAPYGYRYVSRPHGGELVIDDEQAAVVRQIYQWLTAGRLSSYEIARRLHAEAVPSKGDLSAAVCKRQDRTVWSPNSVRAIISNETYRGRFYWGKTRIEKRYDPNTRKYRKVHVPQPREQWIAVDVPAIVNSETWEEAERCLAENKARSPRHAKRDYLLQGQIFCPCGRRWAAAYKNDSGRAYYHCPSSNHEPWRKACPTRFSYRQEAIEGAVWRYVMGELLNPDNLGAEIEHQRQAAAAETARRTDRLRAIEAELRDIDRKLGILVGQALEGLPQSVLDAHKRELLDRRHDLEEQQRRTLAEAERVSVTEATVETLQGLARVVQEAEPHLTPRERRQMLALLRLRVDVLDAAHIGVSGLVSEALVDIPSAWYG